MTVLSLAGTVGILAMIPAFAVLYRGLFVPPLHRSSIRLTIVIAAGSAAIWLIVRACTPGTWRDSLGAPVAALAAVAGALASLQVRARKVRSVPTALFSLAWIALVFCPVALLVFFPADVGLSIDAGPRDLGGGLVIGVAVGAMLLAGMVLTRRATGAVGPPLTLWHVLVASLVLWAAAVVGYESLEGAVEARVSTRILVNTLLAPPLAIVGWLLVERIQTGRMGVIGGVAGLVGGITGIAAGAASLSPLWAGVVGLLAGIIGSAFTGRTRTSSAMTTPTLVGAHLVAAAVGIVLLGLFALDTGMLYTGQTTEVQVQFLWTLGVAVWSAIVAAAGWLLVRHRLRAARPE